MRRLQAGGVVTAISSSFICALFFKYIFPSAAIGFNVEQVTYKNLKFQVWDLGGQTSIKSGYRENIDSSGYCFVTCHFKTWLPQSGWNERRCICPQLVVLPITLHFSDRTGVATTATRTKSFMSSTLPTKTVSAFASANCTHALLDEQKREVCFLAH